MLAPDDFKRVLSHWASGVTVMTTRDGQGRPVGLTASAFASVSLSPPLILVCVAQSAQSLPALQASAGFAVNILAQGQEAISNRFASSVGSAHEKFDGIAHKPGSLGYPLLNGALAHLECATVHAYAGGDHTIFVGQVEAGEIAGETTAEALLYYRGRYGGLRPPAGPT